MTGIRLQEKIQGVLKSALHKTAGIREALAARNGLDGVSTLDEYIERIGWRAKGANIGIAVVIAFVISFVIATEKSLSASDKATGVLIVFVILCAAILFLIKRIPRNYLAEHVWKVECPYCYDYIPFDSWYSQGSRSSP